MTTFTVHQNHSNGSRVFCFSQSMFGGGSKIWGTVKVCKKYTWVILDDSTQERVRYDRALWYSQEQWNAECDFVREMHKRDNEKLQIEKEQNESKVKSITSELKKGIAAIGNKIRILSKYAPDMMFIYEITNIDNEGRIWGKEDGTNREVFVCSVGNDYYAI